VLPLPHIVGITPRFTFGVGGTLGELKATRPTIRITATKTTIPVDDFNFTHLQKK
jgi:hypothetical protein